MVLEEAILKAIDSAGYYVVEKKAVHALFRELGSGVLEGTVCQLPTKLIEKAKEVVSEKQEVSKNEERVLAAITAGKTRFKNIALKSKVPVGNLNFVLSKLIKAGKVSKAGFGEYELAGKKKVVEADIEEEEIEGIENGDDRA